MSEFDYEVIRAIRHMLGSSADTPERLKTAHGNVRIAVFILVHEFTDVLRTPLHAARVCAIFDMWQRDTVEKVMLMCMSNLRAFRQLLEILPPTVENRCTVTRLILTRAGDARDSFNRFTERFQAARAKFCKELFTSVPRTDSADKNEYCIEKSYLLELENGDKVNVDGCKLKCYNEYTGLDGQINF